MPRINLDERLFSDERFLYVMQKIGRYEAMGQLIFLIKTAQRYWAENEKKIPENIFKLGDYSEEFFNAGLLQRHDDGIYLAGSREYFNWIIASKKNGAKGGRPRKNNNLKNPEITQAKPKQNLIEPKQNHINIHKNINIKEKYIKRKVDPLRLINMWNKYFPTKSVKGFGISGKHLNNFLQSNEFLQDDIKNWEMIFSKVRDSDFLRENKRITFNWVLDYDNLQNIEQDKYANEKNNSESVDKILNALRDYNPTDKETVIKIKTDLGDLSKIFEKIPISTLARMSERNAKQEILNNLKT